MHTMHVDRFPPTELKRISVLVPAPHCERLDEIAKAQHRTFSQELRRLIEERVTAEPEDITA